MNHSNKQLRLIEARLSYLLTDIFEQSITKGYFSKLQIKAILRKNKYIKQYYTDIINFGISDTVSFIGREKFPLYGASGNDRDIIDYMIPYILFFMEDNYNQMKRIQLEQNLSMQEIFDTIGKNRLAVFISSSVNSLYNETIVKTSRQANIKYFRFIAVIDARTSMICRSLNQKILSEFQSYFFPELHPHCRSRIEPVIGKFDNNKIFNGQLRATDTRRLSWYKSTYACNINDLNIDALLIKYL